MTIVGEGPLLSDYIEYINNHKLQDKIKILGWSDNIELIYRTHNVLLFPSKFEGFGNVLVEALYCGLSVLPVIVIVVQERYSLVIRQMV